MQMKPPPPPRGKEEGTDGRTDGAGNNWGDRCDTAGGSRAGEQADQTGRGPKLGLMDNEAHLTSLTMMTMTILEGFCRSASRNGWMHGNASDAGKLANTLGEQNEISSPSSGEAL